MWTLVGSQPPTFLGLVGRSDIRIHRTRGLWWSVIHYVGFVDCSGANRVTGRIDICTVFFFFVGTVNFFFFFFWECGNVNIGTTIMLISSFFFFFWSGKLQWLQECIYRWNNWIWQYILYTHESMILVSCDSFSYALKIFLKKQKQKYMFFIWNLRNYLNPPFGLCYAI